MLVNWYECGQQAARSGKINGTLSSAWIITCRKEYDDLRKVVNRKKNVDDYRDFVQGFWNTMSDGEVYKR